MLYKISNMIPVFNIGIKEDVKKVFGGYTDEEIEKFRLVFIFGRGSHSKKVVQERVTLLSELLEKECNK